MEDQVVFVESQFGVVGEGSDGTYPVTILTPGLGATAFYSEAVIKRDAPVAFPKGTHVYLTHKRGEGGEPDPGRLLGFLVEDTLIRESDGAATNRFKPIRKHAEFVEDVHKGVGLSIAAAGTATMGMIEGKQVRIAQSIDKHIANTVDMVSYPGRPGSGFVESAFAQFIEKDVQTEPSAPGTEKNGNRMEIDEKLIEGLIASNANLVTLVESRLPEVKTPDLDVDADRKAAVAATKLVESAKVPDAVKATLIEGIEAGNYEVEAEIAKVTALRESLKTEVETELRESGHAIGANGASGSGEAPKVNGWAA